MKSSEITLMSAIEKIKPFSPVKIVFNGIVLYNDYDSNTDDENGLFGEILPPLNAIPERLWKFDRYIVTSLNIEIVDFHHCIVTMQGEYQTK